MGLCFVCIIPSYPYIACQGSSNINHSVYCVEALSTVDDILCDSSGMRRPVPGKSWRRMNWKRMSRRVEAANRP